MVKDCWYSGDLVGNLDLYQELMALDECAEGKDFYNSYLDLHKYSVASGLANYMKKVLNQFGWLMSKTSIGQTVAKNWQKLAEVNAVARSSCSGMQK